MGLFSRLFGKGIPKAKAVSEVVPDSVEVASSAAGSFPQTFSFDVLRDVMPVIVDDELQALVQQMCEEAFPDEEGIQFVVKKAVTDPARSYAEVVPNGDTGYEKYVIVYSFEAKVLACYAFEDGAYGLLFT